MEKTRVPIEEVKTAEQAKLWLDTEVVFRRADADGLRHLLGRIVGWDSRGILPWLIYSLPLDGRGRGHRAHQLSCAVGGPSKGAVFGHQWARFAETHQEQSNSFLLASDPRCDGWKIRGLPKKSSCHSSVKIERVPIEEVKTAEQAQPWLGEPVVCKHTPVGASNHWFGRIVGWLLDEWLIYSPSLGGNGLGHDGGGPSCTVGGPSKGIDCGHQWARFIGTYPEQAYSFLLASDPRCDGWEIHGLPNEEVKASMACGSLPPAPSMCGPGTVTRPRVANERVLDINWNSWCPICHRRDCLLLFVSNRGERWSGCKTCLLTILRDAGQIKNPVSDKSWRHRKRQKFVEELRAGTHDDAPIKTRPRGADWEPKERDPVDEAIEAFRPVKDGDA